MRLLLNVVLALALVCAVSSVPVQAASGLTKRVIGQAELGALLYGREHLVEMPDGTVFTMRYDANGAMYSNGHPTGDTVKATRYSWCDFAGAKLRRCLTVWQNGNLYVAKNLDGTPAFGFVLK